MQLQNIFLNNLIINAIQISRDSKIYEAFKPQLYDILNISLEDYMKDKELRKQYRYKYLAIKTHFQKKNRHHRFSDEDCLIKITEQGHIWKEFVVTAIEHTSDKGRMFLEKVTMEKFVIMSIAEKKEIEDQIVLSAVTKIRELSNSSETASVELDKMLNDNTNTKIITHIK